MNRLLTLLLVLIFSSISSVAFAEKTFTYVVRKGGETCDKIAKRVYGEVTRIDLLHKYNNLDELCWLGKKQKLPAGMKLKLPEPPASGMLSSASGNVNSKPPTSKWKKAKVGQDLYRQWQVNTFEKSQAEVTFRDTSQIKMRENTLIVIYGETKTKTRSRPTRARLEKGTLRTAFSSNAGGGMVVETPSSESEVKSNMSLVSVEDNGTTRIANHGDGKIVVKSNKKKRKKRKRKKRKKVVVKKGMGTKVVKGKDPEPPRKLPLSPMWKPSSMLFLTIDNAPTTIHAEWEPVKTANEYYIEISKDARGVDIIQSIVVPKNITRLELKNLPEGDYYASVSTIDDDQFESFPLGPRRLRVRSAKSKGELVLENPLKGYLGASLLLPRELKCGLGDVKSRSIHVESIGAQVFDCVDNSGQKIAPFSIIGISPKVELISEGWNEEEKSFTFLESGAFINLKFSPSRPRNIIAESDNKELKFGRLIPVGDDEYRMRVYGKGSGNITIKSGDMPLSSFKATPETKIITTSKYVIGAGLEFFGPDTDMRFSQPVHWGMVELMAGIAPNENFALELSVGLGAFDFDEAKLNYAMDVRLRGLLGVNFGSFNPFVLLSAGAQTHFPLKEMIPVIGIGGGFNYWFTEAMGLRLDGAIGVSEGQTKDISLFPELRIKSVWKW